MHSAHTAHKITVWPCRNARHRRCCNRFQLAPLPLLSTLTQFWKSIFVTTASIVGKIAIGALKPRASLAHKSKQDREEHRPRKALPSHEVGLGCRCRFAHPKSLGNEMNSVKYLVRCSLSPNPWLLSGGLLYKWPSRVDPSVFAHPPFCQHIYICGPQQHGADGTIRRSKKSQRSHDQGRSSVGTLKGSKHALYTQLVHIYDSTGPSGVPKRFIP